METKPIFFKKYTKKDCFNSCRFIYEFDKKVGDDFVGFLSEFGHVNFFPDFPIPYVKMDVPNKFRLTAVFGEKSFNIFFKEACKKSFIAEFEDNLNTFLQTIK